MSSPICRVCGTSFNLMHVLQGGQELLEKLRICANIKIDLEGNLPKHICFKCEQGLSFSYRLRKQGEAMELKLRQKQKENNAIDLSNEVDDIEDALQEFRVQNAKKKNENQDDDVEIIECLEPNKTTTRIQTDKTKTEIKPPIKKQNFKDYLKELTAKAVKQKQVVESIEEDVTVVKNNLITTDANYNLATAQPMVDQADVVEKFTPMEMLPTEDVDLVQQNDEQIKEIYRECVKENSNNHEVIQVDDDIEIIDEYQPWVEDAAATTTTITNTHLEPYQPAVAEQQLDIVEYTEGAFDTTNLVTTQNQPEIVECIQEAECDNEQDVVEIIDDFNSTTQQIDAAIIAQDNLENDLIESGFQVVPENVKKNFKNETVLEQNIGFQTLEKYSIDLIDKVEVVSEVEYDNAEDVGDAEDADYAEYAEDAEDVEYVDDLDDVDYVPETNMHSALMKLQNHAQLKVSLVYKCDTCSESFHRQSEYRLHIKQHGRERYSCIQCNKWFPSRYRLRQHERTHAADIDLYVCSLCANRYRHPQNLKRHMRSVHNTEQYNPNQCGICHEVFTRPDVLKNHMTKHIDDRNFECELCQKTFKSTFYLMAHKRIHLPKTNSSTRRPINSSNNTPAYTSTDSSSSPQHNATVQRVYTCAYCGKISKHNFAHKNHLRTHTLERPYACEFCAKKFRTLAAKITHERIHNDVRPYQCDRCLLSFRQPSHLKEHKLIHDGVMAFVCTVCNIAFTKKSNLKVHMRIHTGERPYKCAESDCGQQFAKLSQLKRHAVQAHARDVEVLEGDDDDENEEDDEEEVDISEEDGVLLNREEEELLRLNVGIDTEDTAMEMLLENNTHYNSLYILDDMNSS